MQSLPSMLLGILLLVGCGARPAETDVRPFHPTCQEACLRDCSPSETAPSCQARCDQDCSPAPSEAEVVSAFVLAVQRGTDEAPIPAVIAENVAFRVYVTALTADAMAHIDPRERPTFVAAWEEELGRVHTEDQRRAYLRSWREAMGIDACSVTPGTLDESPFVVPPGIESQMRARLEVELRRAASWRSVFEVRCGETMFRVVTLHDSPALVPLL